MKLSLRGILNLIWKDAENAQSASIMMTEQGKSSHTDMNHKAIVVISVNKNMSSYFFQFYIEIQVIFVKLNRNKNCKDRKIVEDSCKVRSSLFFHSYSTLIHHFNAPHQESYLVKNQCL